MRKYLFAIYFLTVCNLLSFSQNKTDSMTIVNLKIKLINLKGTLKVDCLNDIAREYQYLPSYRDSMYQYASETNKLAEQINYKKGLASSLTFYGLYELAKKNDIATADKYFQQSEQIGNEINNDAVLGWNYLAWSDKYGGGRARSLSKWKKDSLYLDLLKKANYHFQKAGDEEGEAEASTWISSTYLEIGKPDEAFPYCERTVALCRLKRVHNLTWGPIIGSFSFANMSQIFEAAGDYETAMDYLRQGREYDKQYKAYWDMSNMMGMLFCKMNQPDSALYYFKKNYEGDIRKRPKTKIDLGTAYLLNKDYDLALPLFKSAVDSLRTAKLEVSLPWGLVGLAKAYEGKKDYKTALKYAKEGFQLAMQRNRMEAAMDGANVLSRLYHQLRRNNSAYSYLQQYTTLKDSATNKQYLWKLNIKLSNYKKAADDAKKETRIGFLNRDNKIKEQQLKQEASFKKFLLVGLLLLFIASVFIVRTLMLKRKNDNLKSMQLENKLKMKQLENDNRQTEFQKKTTELEMQALRAQMNPHFIFNCLSSINRFILKNEPDTASDYLTRFSRLIRMVLLNSQKSLITLEDELEMLTIYLDMERLRFKNTFDYHIIFTNRVDAGAIYIPPLLLQPFCENAIWHGLKHLADPQSGRHEHGRLDIVLNMEDKVLNCIITDNGIGRQKAAEIKSKSAEENKSMGLKITTERLALLNQENEVNTSYEIADFKDEAGNVAGTCVKLKISLTAPVEEYA